jgi:hypothetical protein
MSAAECLRRPDELVLANLGEALWFMEPWYVFSAAALVLSRGGLPTTFASGEK